MVVLMVLLMVVLMVLLMVLLMVYHACDTCDCDCGSFNSWIAKIFENEKEGVWHILGFITIKPHNTTPPATGSTNPHLF